MTRAFARFISVIWCFGFLSQPLWPVTVSQAEETDFYYLSLRDLKLSDGVLHYSVMIPCNADAIGITMEYSRSREGLALAFLVKRKKAFCAGLPRLHTDQLPEIDMRGLKKIVKLAQSRFPAAVHLVLPDDVFSDPKNNRVQALYGSRCQEPRSSVLVKFAGSRRIGLVRDSEYSEDEAGDTECVFSYRSMDLGFLKAEYGYQPLVADQSIKQIYDFRIRRVESYSKDAQQTLRFRYERQCQDVPVAVAISGDGETRVGILVAHFFNTKCGSKDKRTAEYVVKGLALPIDGPIKTFASTNRHLALRMRAPTSATINQSTFRVGVLPSCGKPVAIAIRPGEGQFAVGVLEHVNKTECNLAEKEIFLTSGLKANTRKEGRIFPLEVKGSRFL